MYVLFLVDMVALDNDCLRNVFDFLPTEALMGNVSIVGKHWRHLAEIVVRPLAASR